MEPEGVKIFNLKTIKIKPSRNHEIVNIERRITKINDYF